MALIQALLVVAALAAVAAALMIRSETARQRLEWRFAGDQATLYLASGVELLRETLPTGPVHPDQDWARPREGLEIDRGFLSWQVQDLQGRFDLNTLRDDPEGTARAALERLMRAHDLPGPMADAVLSQIDARIQASEDPMPLTMPMSLRAVLGDNPRSNWVENWEAFARDIAALPDDTVINLNTMSDAVLQSLLPGLDRPRLQVLRRRLIAAPEQDADALATWAETALGADLAGTLRALPLGNASTLFLADLRVSLDTLSLRRSVVIDTGGPGGAGAVLMSIPG